MYRWVLLLFTHCTILNYILKNLRQDTDVLWSLQHIHMYNFLQIVHTKYCGMYYNGLHNQIHSHDLSILLNIIQFTLWMWLKIMKKKRERNKQEDKEQYEQITLNCVRIWTCRSTPHLYVNCFVLMSYNWLSTYKDVYIKAMVMTSGFDEKKVQVNATLFKEKIAVKDKAEYDLVYIQREYKYFLEKKQYKYIHIYL